MKILRAVLYVLGIFLTLLNVASVLNIDSNRIPSDTPGRIGISWQWFSFLYQALFAF